MAAARLRRAYYRVKRVIFLLDDGQMLFLEVEDVIKIACAIMEQI